MLAMKFLVELLLLLVEYMDYSAMHQLSAGVPGFDEVKSDLQTKLHSLGACSDVG